MLQEFCQDVILKHTYMDLMTNINFYKFTLRSWGNLSTFYPGLTQEQLTDEAKFINEAIYSLAIGNFDTSELARL